MTKLALVRWIEIAILGCGVLSGCGGGGGGGGGGGAAPLPATITMRCGATWT